MEQPGAARAADTHGNEGEHCFTDAMRSLDAGIAAQTELSTNEVLSAAAGL